jgi:hypothetical protein
VIFTAITDDLDDCEAGDDSSCTATEHVLSRRDRLAVPAPGQERGSRGLPRRLTLNTSSIRRRVSRSEAPPNPSPFIASGAFAPSTGVLLKSEGRRFDPAPGHLSSLSTKPLTCYFALGNHRFCVVDDVLNPQGRNRRGSVPAGFNHPSATCDFALSNDSGVVALWS